MKLLPSLRVVREPKQLDTLARRLLLAVVFLLPLAVVPATWMSLPAIKMTILAIGVLGALLAWAVARFKEHTVTLPDTHIIWGGLLLVLGYFISALLAHNVMDSLVGYGFERDTVFAMVVLVAALATTALTTKTVTDFMRIQRALLVSFGLLGLFQIARVVIGANVVLPSIFSSDPTASLIGSWNDLAVLSGIVTLTSLTGLALFSARRMRIGMYAVLAIAVVLLSLVNLASVWAMLALTTFFLMVYIFSDASYDRETDKFTPRFPWARMVPSIGVVIVSALFLVSGNAIGAVINNTFNIAFTDVRPSWEGTMGVGAAVYKENLLFGNGPSSFSDAWTAHRSPAINETTFWNADFSSGIGLIPTAFVNGGIVVGILWIVFFAALVYLGFKILIRRLVHPSLMYITVSSYVAVVFVWALSIVYVPQLTVLAYMFILTGAAVAAAVSAGVITTREFNAERNYATGLTLTGALMLTLLVTVGALGLFVERTYATNSLMRAAAIARDGDFEKASRYAVRARMFINDGRSQQLLTSIGIARLSEVLSTENDDVEAQRAQFQAALSDTITAAQAVVAYDVTNFRAWVQLGDVYGELVPLKIEGAYESALQAYREARARNATSPLPAIRIAQLELRQENYEGARSAANEALKLKSNYTDAYYLLSQVAIAEDKADEAIASTEAAVLLRPDNAGLLFQLGVLQYSAGEYAKVVPVLERAVTINPNYSNALYFLGLAYDQTDNAAGALAAFKRIASLNPDNEDIAAIVVALESGQSALSVLQQGTPEVTSTSELPVPTSQQ